MKKLLAGFAALPFLAGVAMAGQPAPLSDTQMDHVTAGLAEWFSPGNGMIVIITTPTVAPPGVVVENFPSLDGVGFPRTGFPTVTVGTGAVVTP
jgi:hypothetical protein